MMLFVIGAQNSSTAQITLPPGFNQVLVAPGITTPTTMDMAPDGRIFICQQNGILKVVKNGAILPQPFVSISVNTNGERGLLGVAVDPDFTNNNYIYVCYTVASGDFNRVSRFTASGDTAVPGSEFVVIDLDTLIANYHGGGHLDFGPDSTLYIAAGENGRPTKAQDLDSYLGKIIRVNRDGTTPADNPYPGPTKRKNVWASGLRNPFTFAFQNGTGTMFINDVGDTTYEEINDGTIGGMNFGWPIHEGYSADTAYDTPYYVYIHGTAVDEGCAISGGDFFSPDSTDYPPSYMNSYFYIDYCGDWINRITLGNPPVWSNFATGTPLYNVGLMTGNDGNLYFLSRNNEALYKIIFDTNSVPFVLNDPMDVSVSVGYPASFTVNASGAAPLSYQWRKDTTDIPGADSSTYIIPSTAFADSGNYNCVVTNVHGSTTSNNAHLTVNANQPPTATIDTPLVGSTYAAGDTIFYFGSATDPEDGVVPDSVFIWECEFHHETHVHPGPDVPDSSNSGYFIIPNIGEVSPDVFYRLYLIVFDSSGVSDTTYVDIVPRLSTMIINTEPQGLSLLLDGTPFTAPDTVVGVEGVLRSIEAPYTQTVGQNQFFFTHWNNGEPLLQEFATPVDDSVYTAYYDTVSLAFSLGGDTTLCVDDSLVIDLSGYDAHVWSDGSMVSSQLATSATPDTMMFIVTVMDSTGAVGHDTLLVFFDICSSIPELPDNAFQVYPVPSPSEITIGEMKDSYLLNVSDVNGRVIIAKEKVDAGIAKRLQLSEGVYFISISNSENKVLGVKKVIIGGK